MKTLGLIGGMSWESTSLYYRLINQQIKTRLGGLHSAKVCLVSVDFAEVEHLQHQGDWDALAVILADAAKSLQAAGANNVMICTNTMHKVAEQVASVVDIPLLHLAEATAEQLLKNNITQVGLLGTRFTMEQAFYREKLEQKGIQVLVPEKTDRDLVHHVIYDELCKGEIRQVSKQSYLDVIDKLAEMGAQGVILGCTEIGMLVKSADTNMVLFDTTAIHAEAAVEWALK